MQFYFEAMMLKFLAKRFKSDVRNSINYLDWVNGPRVCTHILKHHQPSSTRDVKLAKQGYRVWGEGKWENLVIMFVRHFYTQKIPKQTIKTQTNKIYKPKVTDAFFISLLMKCYIVWHEKLHVHKIHYARQFCLHKSDTKSTQGDRTDLYLKTMYNQQLSKREGNAEEKFWRALILFILFS